MSLSSHPSYENRENITSFPKLQKLALEKSQTKLGEQATCVRAPVAAKKSLGKELSDLKAEKESPKQLDEGPKQNDAPTC